MNWTHPLPFCAKLKEASMFKKHSPKRDHHPIFSRQLSHEPLETRRLLAVIAGNFLCDILSSDLQASERLSSPLPSETDSALVEINIANLNSKSDSLYSIYLDFDGHTTSNTNWNKVYTNGADIITPRFTLDGDTSKTEFTAAENAAIYEIWLRVSEDFMPFDVNVTTVEPDSAVFNDGRAQRVVIGGFYSDWFGSQAGGISWNDSFSAHIDLPNFVFSESLAGNVKNIAEAVSHETGHALGLNHKGNSLINDESDYYTGTNGWAPIMGASYYQELTQWSKGEYEGAINKVDELAVITSNNGFGYRADDYPDTLLDAVQLSIVNQTGEISGIIETNTDIDAFVFETDGSELSFRVGGTEGVTNLDVLVNIYNSSDELIYTYDPAETLYTEFLFAEEAGTYYITVEGTGLSTDWPGVYSDYGSLGAYSILVGYPDTIVVTTLDDTISDDGFTSLREALLLAADRTSIVFDDSLSGGAISLTGGVLQLNRSVTISAESVGGISIDGQSLSRVLAVSGTVTLTELAITGGAGVTKGAGIENSGNLTLINCSLTENIAESYGSYLVGGGALYNNRGAVATMIGCELMGNQGNFGGAVYNEGTLIIEQSTIADSESWQWNGGAVYNDGLLVCTDSVFYSNTAADHSGSIVGGGAVYNTNNADARFVSTDFIENTGTFGGAIINFGSCVLDSVRMQRNSTTSLRGGAVFNYAELTVINSIFSGNVAPEAGDYLVGGGALYNAKNGTASIVQSLFYDNEGNFGGAIVNAGTMTVTSSTLTRNRSNGCDGGGILNAGTLDITNTVIAGNRTEEDHPDICNYAGSLTGSYNISSFDNWLEGEGNIVWNGDALFADPDQDHFYPASDSALIDAGSNDFVVTSSDLIGNSRIFNRIVDIGAFEYLGSPAQLKVPEILTGSGSIYVSYGANRHLITLSSVDHATCYEIAYSADGENWTTFSSVDPAVIVTGLSYGATISYRVRALGSGLYTDSSWSIVKSFNVCPMDINGDGDISGGDRTLLAGAWLSEDGDDEYRYHCDINGDGDIGGADRVYLTNNWLCEAGDDDLSYPSSRCADILFAEYASADSDSLITHLE